MKKLLIFALCVFTCGTLQADTYNVQKTWATGDTITTDLNSDPQEISRILNGNLDSSNVKDGTLRDVDFDSSYPFDLTKTAGSSVTENLEDILENTATNDSKGWIQGCWIERKDKDELYINPGTIAIGGNLYQETSAITVDISTAWSASALTGGYDSGISTNAQQNTTWYNIYLTTTTGDPDGYQVLIDNVTDATPTDVSVGTNARLIATYYHKDSTTGIQMLQQMRPEGVYGWNFIVGDGAAGCAANAVAFNVTFDRPPYTATNYIGDKATSTVPTDIITFTDNNEISVSLQDVKTTTFDVRIWVTNGANSNASNNYGYTYFAAGSWNQ